VTIAFNVPLNDALAIVKPDSPEGESIAQAKGIVKDEQDICICGAQTLSWRSRQSCL
jgi:hypothetical protein